MIQNKIINHTELVKSKGILQKPIVFTNGVFDILHNGHTQYLEDAKNHGNTLIVALNSDSSVRMLNKSPERPFNKLSNRKEVIAALESVDYVTEFDQKTPLSLISKLKPDIYIKGGDYNMDDLEEARLVRSWGGKAFTISFRNGFSTTSLIKKIRQQPKKIKFYNFNKKNLILQKAVFLDRDGVINKDTGYISKCEDFIFLDSVHKALKLFAKAGYKLVLITNQSGIARGLFKENEFLNICSFMTSSLAENDIFFDEIYYCPHHPEAKIEEFRVKCNCRKPEIGMIRKAENDLGINLKESVIIGDKISDLQAGFDSGISTRYLISKDLKNFSKNQLVTKTFPSLWECSKYHVSI